MKNLEWKSLVHTFNTVMNTDYDQDISDINKIDLAIWDSFKMVELLVELQSVYAITFDIGFIGEINSLRDLFSYMKK